MKDKPATLADKADAAFRRVTIVVKERARRAGTKVISREEESAKQPAIQSDEGGAPRHPTGTKPAS